MWCPCHHDLRLFHLLEFLYGDQVGKCLERMPGGSLHAEYRSAGIFDEPVDDDLFVVICLALEEGKGTHADHVAIASHHRDGFQQMFRLVSVHDHSSFRLELPCSLVDIQYDDIHAEIQCCLLGAQSGTQTRVEEYHQQGLVSAELLVRKRVFLYVSCRFKCLGKVTELCY